MEGSWLLKSVQILYMVSLVLLLASYHALKYHRYNDIYICLIFYVVVYM